MPKAEIFENVYNGLFDFVASLLSHDESNQVELICLKTYNSPGLPIYNSLPAEYVEAYLNSL